MCFGQTGRPTLVYRAIPGLVLRRNWRLARISIYRLLNSHLFRKYNLRFHVLCFLVDASSVIFMCRTSNRRHIRYVVLGTGTRIGCCIELFFVVCFAFCLVRCWLLVVFLCYLSLHVNFTVCLLILAEHASCIMQMLANFCEYLVIFY